MTTLREILEAHPEWADIPIAIYRADGTYDFLGGGGTVYLDDKYSEDDGTKHTEVIVFAGN